MIEARVSQDWQQQIQGIAAAVDRKEAEVVQEAIAQYLTKTDPVAVEGAIGNLQDRVAILTRKLAELGRLVD